MSVCIVGGSRLLQDMVSSTCNQHHYKVSCTSDSVDPNCTLSAGDTVIYIARNGLDQTEADVEALRARAKDGRIIVIVDSASKAEAEARLSGRVHGVIAEETSAETLIGALAVVREGYRLVSADFADSAGAPPAAPIQLPSKVRTIATNAPIVRPTATREKLSERERAILEKLRDGSSNKDIANTLGICEATVKVHLRTCFRKIGAKNRTQAALWASRSLP